MKKTIGVVIVLLTVLICTNMSYGDALAAQPYYVGTKSHNELFNISDSGKATMNVALSPLSSASMNEVKVTLTIKNSSGTKVYNRTYNMPWNSVYGKYKLTKEYQLPNSGTYSFQATYKCYKNNTLLETINTKSIYKSY